MACFLNITRCFRWFLFLVPNRVPRQNKDLGPTYPMLIDTRKIRANLLELPDCIHRVETKRIKHTSVCGARGLMMAALPTHTEVRWFCSFHSVDAIRRLQEICSSLSCIHSHRNLFLVPIRVPLHNRNLETKYNVSVILIGVQLVPVLDSYSANRPE